MTFLECERKAIRPWLLGFVASPFLYSRSIVGLVHCVGTSPVRPAARNRFARNTAYPLGAVFIASTVTGQLQGLALWLVVFHIFLFSLHNALDDCLRLHRLGVLELIAE